MEIKIVVSEDGSNTLYLPHLNETYHSLHGAVQESEHVFLKHGIFHLSSSKKKLTVLEIGFGTGLNALLTYRLAINIGVQIDYHTIEAFPLKDEIVKQLNYPSIFAAEKLDEFFYYLHSCAWDKPHHLSANFIFHKYLTRLEEFNPQDLKADVVFYDAFAPGKQPEMWELDKFEKLHALLNPGGVLVSYCASGQFKRNLKAAGFIVESLPGPPGKKEMTRGVRY
ncbi:MAG TPA: tRNA (5-methylaminomethyl-2-thiouridine)(34)-methyltransferase MnmD [Cytophagaceae bacterium]|jgi:tRNA U34 5-methylaminomethyl-2-thiouridine-forming methyltransferase MnmC|nr:tRNA (5-methylaminomethyl-2-thiouridine)(34)-methyltransferase MnmD [Cytophagaceae bacterium]